MKVVTKLQWDAIGGGGEISGPTPQDVERAIRRLDGESCTEVSLLTGDDDHMLVIDGGKDSQFSGNLVLGAKSLWINHPHAPQGTEPVLVSDPEYDPPLRHVVPLEVVLKAARHFYETGEPSPDLLWDDKEI